MGKINVALFRSSFILDSFPKFLERHRTHSIVLLRFQKKPFKGLFKTDSAKVIRGYCRNVCQVDESVTKNSTRQLKKIWNTSGVKLGRRIE